MSIAEFSDTFKNRIFAEFNNLSRAQKAVALQNQDTTALRTKYESAASGATSVFTKTGITNVLSNIHKDIDNAKLAEYAEAIIKKINYSEFISFVKASSYGSKLEEFDQGFSLSNVPQKTLRNLFLEYIEIVISTDNGTLGHELYDHIAKNIESGHLAGVFSLKILQNLPIQAKSTGEGYRSFVITNKEGDIGKTEETLDVIIKALLDADFLTSNIVDKEEIFISASKTVLSDNPHLQIELQFAKDNRESGNLLQQAGIRLNKLLKQLTGQQLNNKDADDAFKKLVASFKPLAEMLMARAKELNKDPTRGILARDIFNNAQYLNNLADTLIKTKGSPSMLESIELSVVSALKGKQKLNPITTALYQTIKYKDVDSVSKQLNAVIKQAHTELKTFKDKSKKSVKVGTTKPAPKTDSLLDLQLLINTHLQSAISANMGDGAARNVLNYRTGRFAASATVTSLSQSRQGMITAFYEYMKNPYQTFEPGYRQGSPKTRDPKLLIATSIRQIAATKVGNRLRAVST